MEYGVMDTEEKKTFIINSVIYETFFDRDAEKALITPCASVDTNAEMTLIGCLKVDNHELIPSFRVCLSKGNSTFRLKPVKIIRPLPSPHLYRMELFFSSDGLNYHTESSEISIVF